MTDGPDYRKYRAAPKLGRRREPEGDLVGDLRRATGGTPQDPAPRGPRRRISPGRVLKWSVLAAVAWVGLSAVIFLVSATFNQSSVADGTLDGEGFPPFSPTTILVLGSDQRTASTNEPGSSTSGPSRSDSILLLRTGGGSNARLSIPRDVAVDVPGFGRQKINAAYALGGADLAVETVETYLGLGVDHLVEVDFENFPELIDAMGGIDYAGGCVVSRINGGARNGGVTLRLKKGTTRITGKQALALARTRRNACNPRENDLTRARRQQKIFSSMKDRLTSFGAFARLPLISWQAPKAIRSDMSGPTLLGLFGGLATSGDPATRILRPSGGVQLPDGGAALVVDDAVRQREVRRFLRG